MRIVKSIGLAVLINGAVWVGAVHAQPSGSTRIMVDGVPIAAPNFDDGGDINFGASGSTITGTCKANVIGPDEIDETASYTWSGTNNFSSSIAATTAAANTDTTAVATTAFVQQEINGAGGAGLTCSSGSCATASTEQSFLTDAAELTCGSATKGQVAVLDGGTTLQYCDDAATPAQHYIAIGEADGDAARATILAANGANCSAGNYPLGVSTSGAVEGCTPDDDLPDADEVVESMLKVVDSPADEECFTYETTTGDFEWQSCLTTHSHTGSDLSGIDISDDTNLAAGAGVALTGDSLSTASGEADFLASGALTCGASTQGKAQVHTTPLQYCDNAATPTLQYAAYGNSAGAATSVLPAADAADTTMSVALTNDAATAGQVKTSTSLTYNGSTGALSGASASFTGGLTVATPGNSDANAVVTRTATQTLTNKTLTDPAINAAGGSITIPNGTASNLTTPAGAVTFDTNGATSTVPMVALADGSSALPMRTCWMAQVFMANAGTVYVTPGGASLGVQDYARSSPITPITISGLKCWTAQDIANSATYAFSFERDTASNCTAAEGGLAACSGWSSPANSPTCTITGGAGSTTNQISCPDVSSNKMTVATSEVYHLKAARTGTFSQTAIFGCAWMECADATW